MMKDDGFLDLDLEEKQQLQLERLQSTLNRAYRNVPFHQHRLMEMRIDPSGIEHLSDIASLPFMEREHLSENYPYDLFAVPLRDIVRIHTAPGTTRNPTVSGYTLQDLSSWKSILARSLTAANVTPHDILQISFNPGLANWGRDYKDGAERIEAGVIPNTPLSTEKKLMVLRDYKTSVLVTTPASARHLLEHISANRMDLDMLHLKTLILAGEAIDEQTREMMEAQFRVSVWMHYGLSEVPGPAIAFECEHHRGLHIHEDHFLAEIVDPGTGDVLPEGQWGQLVLTSLTTRAFPLIRFKTGDRARRMDQPCPCGRDLARIEWAGERTDDMFTIDGVNVHEQQIRSSLRQLLGIDPETARCGIIRQDDRSCLEVWIPVSDQIFSDEIKGLERLIHRAADSLCETAGVPVIIRLKEKKTG